MVQASAPPPKTKWLSRSRWSLVAGFGLLAMAVLAAFANFGVLEQVLVPGSAEATAKGIAGSELLFRLAMASLVVVVLLDVLVAWALYWFLAPVNQQLAQLAAWFRVSYAVTFLVAISHLAAVLPLSDDAQATLAGARAFATTWDLGLVLFGSHLLLVGWLVFRSGFVPHLIGVLLAIAGLGYLTDSLVALLAAGPTISIAQFTFVGEVALMVWLLIWGSRMRRPDKSSHIAADDSTALESTNVF